MCCSIHYLIDRNSNLITIYAKQKYIYILIYLKVQLRGCYIILWLSDILTHKKLSQLDFHANELLQFQPEETTSHCG